MTALRRATNPYHIAHVMIIDRHGWMIGQQFELKGEFPPDLVKIGRKNDEVRSNRDETRRC